MRNKEGRETREGGKSSLYVLDRSDQGLFVM